MIKSLLLKYTLIQGSIIIRLMWKWPQSSLMRIAFLHCLILPSNDLPTIPEESTSSDMRSDIPSVVPAAKPKKDTDVHDSLFCYM